MGKGWKPGAPGAGAEGDDINVFTNELEESEKRAK